MAKLYASRCNRRFKTTATGLGEDRMTMLHRRAVVTGALAAASLPGLARAANPANGTLRFAILRNGKPFG